MARRARIALTYLTAALLCAMPPDRAEAQVPGSLVLRVLVDLDHQSGSLAEAAGEEGFWLRRIRLIAQASPAPGLAGRVILDPSALAVGPDGAAPFRGAPLVEANVDYQVHPSVAVRGGQQRLPFGLAASAVAPSIPTPEYPLAGRLLMQRVSAFRDIGVAVLGQAGPVEAGAGIFGGAGINVRTDNNRAVDLVGRVSLAARPEWTVGASGWSGRSGALHRVDGVPRRTFHDDARFVRWGVDTRLVYGPLTASVEYLADRTSPNAEAENPTPALEVLRRDGWYAQAALRILPRLELVGRRDRWDPRAGRAGDEIVEWTGGFSWYLHEEHQVSHPRRGRPINFVVRHSRVMLFAEHERPAQGGAGTRLRVRWEAFF